MWPAMSAGWTTDQVFSLAWMLLSITVAVLIIMVAEPYGRDWEQIYICAIPPM